MCDHPCPVRHAPDDTPLLIKLDQMSWKKPKLLVGSPADRGAGPKAAQRLPRSEILRKSSTIGVRQSTPCTVSSAFAAISPPEITQCDRLSSLFTTFCFLCLLSPNAANSSTSSAPELGSPNEYPLDSTTICIRPHGATTADETFRFVNSQSLRLASFERRRDDAGENTTRPTLADLQRRLEHLLKRYTEAHPDVINTRRHIKDLKRISEPDVPSAGISEVQHGAPASPWLPRILGRGRDMYLPDFSYAGYRGVGGPLPTNTGVVLDASKFGVVPDDDKDDTRAIQALLVEAENKPDLVTIQLPPGRILVNEILWLRRSGLILSGSDSAQRPTELVVSRPLRSMQLPDLFRKSRELRIEKGLLRADGEPESVFNRGGVIWSRPTAINRKKMGRAIAGVRGAHSLTTETALPIFPDDVLEIRWCNTKCDSKSLLRHLLNFQPVIAGKELAGPRKLPLVTQRVTVESIVGNNITIREPLLNSIQEEWSVGVSTIMPQQEVGVENMVVKFPNTPYPGHHKEEGYNGIYFENTRNSWVRNVKVINSDIGVYLERCQNITIEDVTVAGRGGHFSIGMRYTNNSLIRNFELTAPALHNPAVDHGSALNVYTNGIIREARFDQHGGLNQQNLFENLRVTMSNSQHLFDHGGHPDVMPPAAAFNTFWNIRVESKNSMPIIMSNAPSARIVGLLGNPPISLRYGPDAYIEGLNVENISIPSLYQYQLSNRRNKL